MASLEELAALLSGANPQSLAAENPYLQFQGPFDQLSSLAMQGAQQPERFSTRDVLLSALAGGFGSGVLGGLGKDYSNTLNDRYSQAVLDFGIGKSPTEASTQLPTGLFTEAGNKGKLFQTINALKEADSMREFKQERSGKLFDALVSKGKRIDPETGQVVDLYDLAGEEANIAKQKKIAEIQGENEAYGLSPELNPNSPQYKLDKDRAEIAEAARQKIEANSPAVKQLKVTETALSRIASLKDLDSATSDVPFATLFIGGLDGSVVREGEYDRAYGTNPLISKWKNLLDGALAGKSKIGVATKQQMFNDLLESQNLLKDTALRQAQPYVDQAIARGVKDPKSVLPFDPDLDYSNLFPTTSTAPIVPITGLGEVEVTDDVLQQAIAELNRRGVKIE